jgi:DNA excision repair protein ERCC-4
MNSFQLLALDELSQEDGLLVMGRGLGLKNLISCFIKTLCSRSQAIKPLMLSFCLNLVDSIDYLIDCLRDLGVDHSNIPQLINNETTSSDRVKLYARGGCFFITSRILIVDLLDGTLKTDSIAGLLVGNAHR